MPPDPKPTELTPEKVTKSFSFAPCALSVTVINVESFDPSPVESKLSLTEAEKVTSPGDVCTLIGVISLNVCPSSI